jgi:hypothetical protein
MLDGSRGLNRITEYHAAGLILASIGPELFDKHFYWLQLVEVSQLYELMLQVTQIHMSLLLD